jgi:hypothetical protein
MRSAEGVVTVGLAVLALAGASADLDCAFPLEARAHVARLRLAEIEYAEDVHREAHWDELGRCPRGAQYLPCRAAIAQRFEALWEEKRRAIDAKYRRMLDDYEERCRASVSLRATPP